MWVLTPLLNEEMGNLVIAASFILWMYGKVCISINRLRDLGRPWFWVFAGIIPLLNLVLFCYLLFVPGKDEPPKYSIEPSKEN